MRLMKRLDGASAIMYGIYGWSIKSNQTITWCKAYVVYSRDPIVLVRSHAQLRHDIALGSFVHDSGVRDIVCVDILEEKHNRADYLVRRININSVQQCMGQELTISRQSTLRISFFSSSAVNSVRARIRSSS